MNIEDVIARSRLPGGFSEHKRFTLARGRAIEKLRRFALADPHDYVLELVQAAVANQAESISMTIARDSCTFAYVGGGLREHELAGLFDFLFASKDRAQVEHLRALALGINAAMLFAPTRVVIESGDGTLAGTHRMVMHPGDNRVDVGVADRPLAGTFIALEGIDRFALPNPVAWDEHSREHWRLEERCLCAPIPIVVNDRPLFGYSSQRVPAAFGFARVISFDEGDLYGTIGIDPGVADAGFRLLTRGVAIQSKVQELIPGRTMGGVVGFDRLRKTVDHAGIVEDERLAELWLRLRPYAERLAAGDTGVVGSTRLLGETAMPTGELCRLVREHARVVVVPLDVQPDQPEGRRALAIGRALQSPVLCVAEEQLDWLYALSGRAVGMLQPALDDDSDVQFYAAAPAVAPARPWLTTPIELPTHALDELAAALGISGATEVDRWVRTLGRAPMRLTLYTPSSSTARAGLDVQVLVSEREVWRGSIAVDAAGHALVVRLHAADRRALRERDADGMPLAQTIAMIAAELALPAVTQACARVLADRGAIAPGGARAWLGLQGVLRSVVPRLRTESGVPVLRFVQIGDDHDDLLGLPLLRTHAGAAVDVRALQAIAGECGGIVRGAPTGAPIADDDRHRVLLVDAREDHMLRAWLGVGSYSSPTGEALVLHGVRLAGFDPTQPTAGVPWLLAGADGSRWESSRRLAVARELVERLGPQAFGSTVGLARAHAMLQLQWAALASLDEPEVNACFVEQRVFVADDGAPCSLREVLHAAAKDGLGIVFDRAPWPEPDVTCPPAAELRTLRCAPALALRLAQRVPVHPRFDAALGVREPPEQAGLLVAVELDDEHAIGRVGFARGGLPCSILVIAADGRGATELRELALEFGATGVLRMRRDGDDALEALLVRVRVALLEAVERLRERVVQGLFDAHDHHIALGYLLELAMRSVRLVWHPDGTLLPHIEAAEVAAILRMPVLGSRRSGAVALGWTLRRFCRLHAAGEPDPLARILADLEREPPAAVLTWMRRWLDPRLVPGRPPTVEPAHVPVAMGASPSERLSSRLAGWLARLRPDAPPGPVARVELIHAGEKGRLLEGVSDPIVVNAEHPLVRRVLESAGDPEPFAWLLLAVYAEINAALDDVRNEHELAFQLRAVEALLGGELDLLG